MVQEQQLLMGATDATGSNGVQETINITTNTNARENRKVTS
jgi:hypothetical protein